MNSPLFSPQQLTSRVASPIHDIDGSTVANPPLLPHLPEKPLTSTSSIQVYIIPTESTLYVQGFDPQEYASRPPALLRGCLYIRILKPSKIKSITLNFKGIQKTDWPEGIPPKRQEYRETNQTISHTWPFYQGSNTPTPNNGADVYVEPTPTKRIHSSSAPSLNDLHVPRTAPAESSSMSNMSASSSSEQSNASGGNFFTRNLSPAFIRRANRSPTISSFDGYDLTSIISPNGGDANLGLFAPGDYVYNFEHPIPASIPETCSVTYGSVEYNLEVTITRPGTFKSNLNAKLPINIVRTPSDSNLEENESIVVTRDWEDQLRYDIVIGSKSIILDLYLPLAFRFVPLFGKVALHRIRIYLTETNEYFCADKKVHRLEPSKKFLLMEHKAQKGKSLLSQNEQDDFEEDILPKELEFQLYVPQELDSRVHTKIHPDTSFDNIQSHHWIKIGLRISKSDPENPGKRKHYEISIDSPLKVLSPLAAHGNTLLPAYDDFIPPTESSNPPPFADHETNLRAPKPIQSALLSVLSRTTSATHEQVDESTPTSPSSPLPIEFHHIATTTDHDGVANHDADMHLEANLYSPKSPDIIQQINSPQALPHPGTKMHPLCGMRPIHLLRNPSINPPAFDADVPPPGLTDGDAPPAYLIDEENLSPLRIDENPGILDRMNQSIGAVDDSSSSSSSSAHSDGPRINGVIPEIRVSPDNPVKELLMNGTGATRMNQNPQNDSIDASLTQQLHNEGEDDDVNGRDIVDYPGSPILSARALLPSPIRPKSRQSSLSSSPRSAQASLDDIPIDQLMPLLNLNNGDSNPSTTGPPSSETRESLGSIVYDLSYSNPNDRNGSAGTGMFRIHDLNLSNLRNPRIRKHYQEQRFPNETEGVRNGSEDDEAEEEEGQTREDGGDQNDRHPSFGVVNNIAQADAAGRHGSESSKEIGELRQVPGFKVGYVME